MNPDKEDREVRYRPKERAIVEGLEYLKKVLDEEQYEVVSSLMSLAYQDGVIDTLKEQLDKLKDKTNEGR